MEWTDDCLPMENWQLPRQICCTIMLSDKVAQLCCLSDVGLNLAWIVWTTDMTWSHKMFSEKWKIQSTHSIFYYLLLKCPIVKWFCGLHIHFSVHLSTRFCAILHFQEVLVFLMNDSFHVGVCCWETDYQLLTVVITESAALYHFSQRYHCILINILNILKLFIQLQ